MKRLPLVLAALTCGVSAFIASPAVASQQSTYQPAYTACTDGADPNGFNAANSSTPVPTASIYGRTIALRWNTNHCAWGKITGGSVGDEVWTDRSYDGGHTWGSGSKLGDRFITSGTDTYTVAYNDYNVVMRACGKAGNRPEIVCTTWW